jgi:MYXO-CTERM domain-containing protein
MRTLFTGTLVSLATLAGIADAHIHLTYPLARTDSMTGDQKEQHCGVLNQVRNPARVTELRPGATITVTWLETINHPGWFRIAFQPNGQTFGIPPESNGPPSNYPTLNQEGVDMTNQSIVLKDRIMDGTLSTQITLPSMECTNCTLQFIQVMTDKPPYSIDALSDDIYFNCADITLSNAAPMAPDAGPGAGPDAGAGGPDAGTGSNDGNVSGGCSTGGGARWPMALALGALLLRRRRRS